MRPWFSAIRKIPDYIHLPAFFNLNKQLPDPIDEKKRKCRHAERVRSDRDKKR